MGTRKVAAGGVAVGAVVAGLTRLTAAQVAGAEALLCGEPAPAVGTRTERRRARAAREAALHAEDRAWSRLAEIAAGAEPAEGEAAELLAALGAADGAPNLLPRYLCWVVRGASEEMCASAGSRARCLASPKAFTRERAIGLFALLRLLMSMGGSSLDQEVVAALAPALSLPTRQALCERRELLLPEATELLFARVTRAGEQLIGARPALAGMPVLAADGTAVNVHGDPSQPLTHVAGKGGGWDQYHLNALYDVGAQVFVAAVLQPVRETHETRALCQMIAGLCLEARSVLVGDRGYGSLNLIETVRRKRNLECLIRVRSNWIKEVAALPLADVDADVTVRVITTQTKADKERVARGEAKYLSGASPYGKYKKSQAWDFESEVDVRFRVVRSQLGSGEWETLVTTLPRDEFPAAELVRAYHLRWAIEQEFRTLKWQNHLAQMHCVRDDLSRQEVWARLAMHNAVSAVVLAAEASRAGAEGMASAGADAADGDGDAPRATACDRAFATALMRRFLADPASVGCDVVAEVARRRVPVRPGRSRPRPLRAIGFAPLHYR